jgi:chemosensory pili system protein ChpA (sensor histidine kinase/response regulator)
VSDDDRELMEVFLLEADEVLTAISASLQRSRATPSDEEPMIELRRSFHTLKGSGRMVGLMQFGDAAWAFEQLLTRCLSDEKPGAMQRVVRAAGNGNGR